MFLQQDLDTMMIITGLSEDALMENKELEQEYMLRLRMFHLDGNQGPLRGIGVIDCLRFVGVEPKPLEVKRTSAATNWSRVPIGSAVIVNRTVAANGETSTRRVLGQFDGEFTMGRLAVKFSGSDYTEEFSAIDVELAPETLSENVLTHIQPASQVANDPNDWGDNDVVLTDGDRDSKREQELQYDPADLTERWKPPTMLGAWEEVNPGDQVLVDYQGKTMNGKFIDVGPKDSEVQVLIENYGGKKGNDITIVLHENKVVPELAPAK